MCQVQAEEREINGFAVCAPTQFPVPHSILVGNGMWDGEEGWGRLQQQQLGEQRLCRWLSLELRHGLEFEGQEYPGERPLLLLEMSWRCLFPSLGVPGVSSTNQH